MSDNKNNQNKQLPKFSEKDIQSLVQQLKSQQEQIDLLTKVADKQKLAKYHLEQEHLPNVKLSFYEGKRVKSWRNVKDVVISRMDSHSEDQRMEITFANGDVKEVMYSDFDKNMEKAGEYEVDHISKHDDIKIIGNSRIVTQKLIYHVKIDGGIEEIPAEFIN